MSAAFPETAVSYVHDKQVPSPDHIKIGVDMKERGRGRMMVAVESVDRSSRSLLRKAATLARARGCGLDLIHIISLPYGPTVNKRASLRQAAQEIVADRRNRLLKLASGPELRGLRPRADVLIVKPRGFKTTVLRRPHPLMTFPPI